MPHGGRTPGGYGHGYDGPDLRDVLQVQQQALQHDNQRVGLARAEGLDQLVEQLDHQALAVLRLPPPAGGDGDLDRAAVAAAALAPDEAAALELIDHAGERSHVVTELRAELRGRDAGLLRQRRERHPLRERDRQRGEARFRNLLHEDPAALQQEADAVGRSEGFEGVIRPRHACLIYLSKLYLPKQIQSSERTDLPAERRGARNPS